MLKTETIKNSMTHDLPAISIKDNIPKEITDESLNSIMALLKSQAVQYKQAGLTQVSNWL